MGVPHSLSVPLVVTGGLLALFSIQVAQAACDATPWFDYRQTSVQTIPETRAYFYVTSSPGFGMFDYLMLNMDWVFFALKAGLLSNTLNAPLALAYTLVSHCNVSCYYGGVLGELSNNELLLDHLDFLIECLQMGIVKLIYVLKEYPHTGKGCSVQELHQ